MPRHYTQEAYEEALRYEQRFTELVQELKERIEAKHPGRFNFDK